MVTILSSEDPCNRNVLGNVQGDGGTVNEGNECEKRARSQAELAW